MAKNTRKELPLAPSPMEDLPPIENHPLPPPPSLHTTSIRREKGIHISGLLFISAGILLMLSLCSHLFFWWTDYDILEQIQTLGIFSQTQTIVSNLGGRLGGYLSFLLINRSFGISAILFPIVLLMIGLHLLNIRHYSWFRVFFKCTFLLLWISLVLGSIFRNGFFSVLAGRLGYQCSLYLEGLIGTSGLYLLLLFSLLCFGVLAYNFRSTNLLKKSPKTPSSPPFSPNGKQEGNTTLSQEELAQKYTHTLSDFLSSENKDEDGLTLLQRTKPSANTEYPPVEQEKKTDSLSNPFAINLEETSPIEKDTEEVLPINSNIEDEHSNIEFSIVDTTKKKENIELATPNSSPRLEHFGIDTPFDPTLDLSDYQFPTIDLLEDFGDQSSKVQVLNEELLANKKKIIDTLKNYSIEISQIKATIGPTVTLYEIVPAAGVRINKIKNLEDDIALSLSALGIRIIAPIPGKGTIGIEVPNNNKQIVPMRDMLTSEKFLQGNFDLPIALGKTISNEAYVTDLSKMPHLLVAGATGQGKSVGLNAIIASLLYKKHPSELKFIMVDPKKVELSLFNKIERHYLAKLPDAEEAIITDTRKVVRTLNSLCIEMDNRYDLLKNAGVKNLKEYNKKFISRRLNPEEGHRFMPYIVLIIDEFADLIMTAGKEIEAPIARLAQLARAIGIHLVIATQRPSVNIITGTIKANFPARIAFKVSSKTDSRTILDSNGADQLIGRGDMLLSTGNELVRLQCAYIDTPEIERITEFIGNQRAYPSAYELPECPDESQASVSREFSNDDRDPLFEEAAQLIVNTQQGSASLIQRKLKLGYNRAGRIIDQLEDAGIVGSFDGKKMREVKIQDPVALDEILKQL
ncbi:MAG: DNA translocase FtsK 4TM domain-containing protein [Bacteroidales bacterium]